jgi:thymidylate synthase (FAD)
MSTPMFLNKPAYLLDVRAEGEDLDVARSAWVSTMGQRAEDEAHGPRVEGLINFLMRERHGSPFEQVGMRFLTKAPIITWREHMRHRMASYNEQSGRYSKPEPEFYVIDRNRPLVQEGKVGAYTFVPGSKEQYENASGVQEQAAWHAWSMYEQLLEMGVAKEVARMHLPPTLYSSAYVRMNLRALMNFLSLRTAQTAMYEIRYLAQLYEREFAAHFPMVYRAWVDNGRVAP